MTVCVEWRTGEYNTVRPIVLVVNCEVYFGIENIDDVDVVICSEFSSDDATTSTLLLSLFSVAESS